MGVEVPQQNNGVPRRGTIQHPRQGHQEGRVLRTTARPVGRNDSQRPIPNPKAQGCDPLIHWGKPQHETAELGGNKARYKADNQRLHSTELYAEGEVPVEDQMVTDGLETNQPGSQDLCPGTSNPFKQLWYNFYPGSLYQLPITKPPGELSLISPYLTRDDDSATGSLQGHFWLKISK
ncbi:hypothetical protein ILYODFUR_027576 [Ilyodon furcidens]|uniref:Uncharacterized protein n=1 Tax=Ilyodon furcidens TaxID=33524 RepID=A0ABV0T4E5_9TELE